MEPSSSLAPPPPTSKRARPSGPRKQAPRQRLHSLGSPAPGRALFVPSSPAPSTNPGRASPTYRCTNPDCEQPDVIVDDSGGRVCQNCGAEVTQANPYVSENTFVDGPNGASQMVGQFVGEGQTHTRSTGGVKGMSSHIGSEARPTREATIRKAAEKMDGHASALGIQRNVVDQGKVIFSLALSLGFVAGRTIENVATVALYVACRRQNKQNKIMLIDFAERENVNVFELGSMYTKMVQKMYGTTHDGFTFYQGSIDAITPESLIDRFAQELDFGRDTHKIARDAVRIVARMERDWMTHGRRPAGICGAALILAARMNNYRRTVREVVLVAKVTEITLNKRLDEFKVTESSTWTVAQFRELAEKKETLGEGKDRKTVMFAGTTAHDPPAFYLGNQPKAPKKRGRKRKIAADTAAEIEGGESEQQQHQGSGGIPQATKRPRIDKDGFAIPALPLDPRLQSSDTSTASSASDHQTDAFSSSDALRAEREGTAESEISQSGERRRRARKPTWQVPEPTAAELAIEAELDADVRYGLEQAGRVAVEGQGQSVDSTAPPEIPTQLGEGSSTSGAASTDPPTATVAIDLEAATSPLDPEPAPASEPPATPKPRKEPVTPGPAVDTNIGNLGHVSLSQVLLESEFEDDPEVSSCLLSEAEKEIKEKIWVTENADWLRKDHAKKIRHELWRAAEKAKGNDPDAPKPKMGKRAGKIGDLSYMKGQRKTNVPVAVHGGDAGDVRASLERAATESVQIMMNERAKVSRRINQNAMRALIGADDRSSTTPSTSRSMSREPSAAGRPEELTEDGINRYDAEGQLRSLSSIAGERRERIKRAKKRGRKERGRGREDTAITVASSTAEGRDSASASASPALSPAPSPARARPRPHPSARTSASPALSGSPGPSYQAQVANRMRTEKQQLPTPSQTQRQPSVEHVRPTPVTGDAGVEEEIGELATVDSPLSSLPSNLDSPMGGLGSHGGFAGGAGDDEDDGESEAGDYVDDEDDGVDDAFQGTYQRPGRVGDEDDGREEEE